MAFISGAYTMTYAGSTVGQISTGITIDHNFFKQLITGDNGGDTPQDAVFRGGTVFIQFNLMEYDATSARACFWPYGSTYLTVSEDIGKLDYAQNGTQSAIAAQIVMTVIANTPADLDNAPNTVTIPTAILAEGFNASLLFAPELRVIPIRMRAYPSQSAAGANLVFGTLT
jgi:hypothetical protein